MSTENPYERQLAGSISESIMHMTGSIPRRKCVACAIAGATIGYGLGIVSLIGALWGFGMLLK